MATGYGGTYKAVVVDNLDPHVQNRLQVRVPDVGIESTWANPMSSSAGALPAIGEEVFVQFVGGDSDQPVWNRDGTAAPAPTTYFGVYQALVVDNQDPNRSNRLSVQVPDVLGNESAWATASPALGSVSELPAVGSGVWVQFEAGDPSHPQWTGVR
jgi:hypothetical protein